ncbi:hypothetical protein [Streptomyces sp. HNM0574]|uniref:hypothetical protein n=1 Tax=Streptomyces sp. HNM0574 TaxID=2714954 RepID=UPI00146D9958|nr:hypothetical protein [Streptomyces sp. HNM0574]NLU70219.1 hypothetical protein [Streptomyces sp. HNM0574]
MANSSHDVPESPALPVLPRSSLMLWSAVQWAVIPLECAARCLCLVLKLAGDAVSADGIDPRRALARDPHRREQHLDRKAAELAEELRTQHFSPATSVFHAPAWKVRRNSKGLTLHPRDCRGLPQRTVERIVAAHGLRSTVAGRPGRALPVFEGELWPEQT